MTALVKYVQAQDWAQGIGGLFSDRVLWFALALLTVIVAIDQQQFIGSLEFLLAQLLAIAPYFAVAILLAGYIKASGADALVARAFSGNPMVAVAGASLVGALSPFCSCGVIPLIASMLAAGVPLGPVMAFWVSSPVMDPEMFLLTSVGIGFEFAIAKTIITVGMGLMAGFSVLLMQRAGFLGDPLRAHVTSGCGASSCGVAKPSINFSIWQEKERLQSLVTGSLQNAWVIGRWLVVAFILESLMIAYIPSDVISSVAGSGSWYAIPLAAIVGVPSYLNGFAAIPLVDGLIDLGMSPGAAITFMTAGAVSSIPAAVAVFGLVRKPVFATYLMLGLTGSIIAGYGFDMWAG